MTRSPRGIIEESISLIATVFPVPVRPPIIKCKVSNLEGIGTLAKVICFSLELRVLFLSFFEEMIREPLM